MSVIRLREGRDSPESLAGLQVRIAIPRNDAFGWLIDVRCTFCLSLILRVFRGLVGSEVFMRVVGLYVWVNMTDGIIEGGRTRRVL